MVLQLEQTISIEPFGAILTWNPVGALAARSEAGPAEVIVATPAFPHEGHSASTSVLTSTVMEKCCHDLG
jgi:hypothetical protein